jgi:hypothetical protein
MAKLAAMMVRIMTQRDFFFQQSGRVGLSLLLIQLPLPVVAALGVASLYSIVQHRYTLHLLPVAADTDEIRRIMMMKNDVASFQLDNI